MPPAGARRRREAQRPEALEAAAEPPRPRVEGRAEAAVGQAAVRVGVDEVDHAVGPDPRHHEHVPAGIVEDGPGPHRGAAHPDGVEVAALRSGAMRSMPEWIVPRSVRRSSAGVSDSCQPRDSTGCAPRRQSSRIVAGAAHRGDVGEGQAAA